MSHAVTDAKSDQRQYKSLKEELANLSTLIVAAKKRLESYQLDEKKAAELSKLVSELTDTKKALEAEIRDATTRKAKADREIERLERLVKTLKIEVKKLEDLRDVDTQRHANLTGQSAQAKKDLTEARKNAREASRVELAGVHKRIAEAREVLRLIEMNIRKSRRETDRLDRQKEKGRDIDASVAGKVERERELDRQIALKEKILNAKNEQIVDVEKSLEHKKRAHDETCRLQLVEISLARKDIEDREGQVNFLQENLKTKAALLTQAKRELEDFHGKQLRHIVIPTI